MRNLLGHCSAFDLLCWLAVREYRNRNHIPALWISSWGSAFTGKGIADVIQLAGLRTGLHDSSSSRMEDHFSATAAGTGTLPISCAPVCPENMGKWLRGDAIREAADIYFQVDPEDVRWAYLAHIPKLGI